MYTFIWPQHQPIHLYVPMARRAQLKVWSCGVNLCCRSSCSSCNDQTSENSRCFHGISTTTQPILILGCLRLEYFTSRQHQGKTSGLETGKVETTTTCQWSVQAAKPSSSASWPLPSQKFHMESENDDFMFPNFPSVFSINAKWPSSAEPMHWGWHCRLGPKLVQTEGWLFEMIYIDFILISLLEVVFIYLLQYL